MIRFKTGNILHEDAEALVNTVNCVGVMGRGVALQFKKAYPENFRAYATSPWQKSVSHREWPGTRPARREEGAYRAIFDRGATMPGGMHGRSNAARLLPRAATACKGGVVRPERILVAGTARTLAP